MSLLPEGVREAPIVSLQRRAISCKVYFRRAGVGAVGDSEIGRTAPVGHHLVKVVRGGQGERRMTRMYAAVVAVEIVVLLALWMFTQRFGS